MPAVLGSQVAKEVAEYVEGQPVQYRNLKISGWAPYLGDDLGLFIGLYRCETNNLINRLLETLEEMAGSLQVSTLSGYLGLARTIADGVSRLAGMEELEFCTGGKDVFLDSGRAADRLRQGYLAYLNCGEGGQLKLSDLWVKEGRLFSGRNSEVAQPLEDYDYCLLRIRLTDKRGDYETLPFHSSWLNARSRALSGDHAVARALIVWCGEQIAESPDLIEDHKDFLISLYYANLEREIGRYSALRQGPPETRGGKRDTTRSDGARSSKGAVQRTTQRARRLKFPGETLAGLEAVTKRWDEIFVDEVTELTNDRLNDQMVKLEKIRGDIKGNPRGLADAIAVGTSL